MAICTKCGTVIHDDDMKVHKCDAENIPERGKERVPTTTEKVLSDD